MRSMEQHPKYVVWKCLVLLIKISSFGLENVQKTFRNGLYYKSCWLSRFDYINATGHILLAIFVYDILMISKNGTNLETKDFLWKQFPTKSLGKTTLPTPSLSVRVAHSQIGICLLQPPESRHSSKLKNKALMHLVCGWIEKQAINLAISTLGMAFLMSSKS